ncbi:MAG: hypothetical protein GY838_19800 [bacterium]|nr:hypothetical protein [bacterium]
MRRRFTLSIVLAAVLATVPATAGEAPLPLLDYRAESWFLPGSPGVTGGPAAGLFNPAAYAMSGRTGADFWWNDRSVRSGLDNYGFALGGGLNFAMLNTTWGDRSASYQTRDYQLGASAGSRAMTFGLGYRWSRGGTAHHPREKALVAGVVSRKHRWVSTGASAALSLESSAAQYIFDLGLRPFGRDWVTLGADWAVNDNHRFFQDGSWGASVEVRPVRGVHLGARARERVGSGDVDLAFVAGININDLGVTGLPLTDPDGHHVMTSWLVRTNPPAAGIPLTNPLLRKGERLHAVNLENRYLTYQKYRYFDDVRLAWLDLLRLLDATLDDPAYDGIALNLAGFRGRPSLMWELREKLREFGSAGKTVVIHGDRLLPAQYHLASVADHLSLDPQGVVALPGTALARSYLKGTLEKLGLGFQEFRYFTYKSAAETLSRDSMSDADRQQRQRIVDVIYETYARDAAATRGLPAGAYDTAVDEQAILVATEALNAKLVDSIGRWHDLSDRLDPQRKIRLDGLPPVGLGHGGWDDQWGPRPRIPVVFAVGPCAMDSGIKGRATSDYLRRLAGDPLVAAVVLRADSPGGDALPSDLIAEAVRLLKDAGKPVIVSQGDVAASGGYWISMDGTEILTTPVTITGSIGVIGGWVWDDGLAGKAGVTSDVVSRGAHADLFTTVNVPLLGSIPRRPLDETELARIEILIRSMYGDFVTAVATGRGLDETAVRRVAEGRVWMGGDAVEHGLCDRIGTLDQAIALARAEAGLAAWQDVAVVEYPPRRLFPFPNFLRLPSLLPFSDSWNATWQRLLTGAETTPAAIPATLEGLGPLDTAFIRAMATAAGRPLLMLSPEDLPAEWREVD